MTDYQSVSKLVQQIYSRRSPYNHHQARVAELAEKMGLALGMSKREIYYLSVGASIHDLGKLLVPEDILHQPRALSESEFEVVKTHSVLGYKIARTLKYHPIVQDVILHHHEWKNGKGYPDRLCGSKISIYAGIVHITDVFDALCSRRSYRTAFRQSDALGIMYEGIGTSFDKRLMKVFLDKVLKEQNAKR